MFSISIFFSFFFLCSKISFFALPTTVSTLFYYFICYFFFFFQKRLPRLCFFGRSNQVKKHNEILCRVFVCAKSKLFYLKNTKIIDSCEFVQFKINSNSKTYYSLRYVKTIYLIKNFSI